MKAKLREDRADARRTNETWAMDFVHGQLGTGRKIRALTMVDSFNRFSPAGGLLRLSSRGCRADLGAHLQNSWLSHFKG